MHSPTTMLLTNTLKNRYSSYSVPFCLRILNCSGDRIARHSSSGLLTDPGAGEDIAVIRPPWKPRLRRRSGGNEEGEAERGRRLGFAKRVILREREGLTKALMVVAEDDDEMTFNAIVALLSLSFFGQSFLCISIFFFFKFCLESSLVWA